MKSAPRVVTGAALLAVTASWSPAQSPPAPSIRVESVRPAPAQPEARDPAVLFFDDFDQPGDLRSRYFEYDPSGGSFAWVAGEGHSGTGAMKCTFNQGQVSAGSLKVAFGRNPFGRGPRRNQDFREIYWRVYVRHEPGWEGNPAKLARATCLAGPDWSQGLIAHVWGGRGDALCIDPASGIRDNRKVTTRYNDFANLRWLGVRNTQTPIFSPSESGRWVCVESHVKVNAPGAKDGVFQLRIDGRLEAERADLDWHGSWNDYGINAVFLENYWNDGAVKRESRWFDDFVISTRPIGPTVSGNPPTLTCTTAPGAAAWEAQVAGDPDGKDVVWTSQLTEGGAETLTVDALHAAFSGSRAGQAMLAPAHTYWLRLRSRTGEGWSGWTAWHSPFRTPS